MTPTHDTAAALEAAIRTFGVCAYSPSEPSSPDSLAAVHIWIEVEEHAGPLRAAITAHVEASIKAALREVPEIDAAIDAVIGAVRDDIGSDGMDAARADLDRAITAHVEAEVARRLAAAPEVEDAIRAYAGYEVDHAHHLSTRSDDDRRDARQALRAAIAADRARAVADARRVGFKAGSAERSSVHDAIGVSPQEAACAAMAHGVPCPTCGTSAEWIAMRNDLIALVNKDPA